MENLYEVIRPFEATTAISGRERQFLPGETSACDLGRPGESIIIEAEEFLLLVDRVTFKACCKWKNGGGAVACVSVTSPGALSRAHETFTSIGVLLRSYAPGRNSLPRAELVERPVGTFVRMARIARIRYRELLGQLRRNKPERVRGDHVVA